MKLDDLAFAITRKVFHELTHAHHFTVPQDIQDAVLQKIKDELDTLIDT